MPSPCTLLISLLLPFLQLTVILGWSAPPQEGPTTPVPLVSASSHFPVVPGCSARSLWAEPTNQCTAQSQPTPFLLLPLRHGPCLASPSQLHPPPTPSSGLDPVIWSILPSESRVPSGRADQASLTPVLGRALQPYSQSGPNPKARGSGCFPTHPPATSSPRAGGRGKER